MNHGISICYSSHDHLLPVIMLVLIVSGWACFNLTVHTLKCDDTNGLEVPWIVLSA